MCDTCKLIDEAMVNRIGPVILANMVVSKTDLATTVENMREVMVTEARSNPSDFGISTEVELNHMIGEVNGWLNTAAARIAENMDRLRQLVALMPEVPDTFPTDTKENS